MAASCFTGGHRPSTLVPAAAGCRVPSSTTAPLRASAHSTTGGVTRPSGDTGPVGAGTGFGTCAGVVMTGVRTVTAGVGVVAVPGDGMAGAVVASMGGEEGAAGVVPSADRPPISTEVTTGGGSAPAAAALPPAAVGPPAGTPASGSAAACGGSPFRPVTVCGIPDVRGGEDDRATALAAGVATSTTMAGGPSSAPTVDASPAARGTEEGEAEEMLATAGGAVAAVREPREVSASSIALPVTEAGGTGTGAAGTVGVVSAGSLNLAVTAPALDTVAATAAAAAGGGVGGASARPFAAPPHGWVSVAGAREGADVGANSLGPPAAAGGGMATAVCGAAAAAAAGVTAAATGRPVGVVVATTGRGGPAGVTPAAVDRVTSGTELTGAASTVGDVAAGCGPAVGGHTTASDRDGGDSGGGDDDRRGGSGGD